MVQTLVDGVDFQTIFGGEIAEDFVCEILRLQIMQGSGFLEVVCSFEEHG